MTAENISPEPLATDLRSADDRDRPSRNDVLVGGLSEIVGGPVGRHALIGRQRFLTPLRVMFMIALVALALGWTTKSPCLQSVGDGGPDQKVANWAGQRAYFELCYSDTVPLYGAELLSEGKFPYKSSWRETDATGKQRIQYDGTPAVRYMEYPVLTGVYQYTAMALAKTYTAVTKTVAAVPVVAEVVMFFDIAAVGLALAWLVTVWAAAGLSGRRVWDAALVAGSPILIFQAFTNFDALATAFATAAMLAWARRRPVLAGVLIGLGISAKLYPLLLLGPLLVLGLRTSRLGDFTFDDVRFLFGQHTADTGQGITEDALARVFELSAGQPWLVNALGREVVDKMKIPATLPGSGHHPTKHSIGPCSIIPPGIR